ncbi:YiiX/YebB-like N1pC/P60 family cysteine hydrolase [Rhodococcus sp. NM-2]|uniref:YiiX/YebB-like N1pC/P60 family cysteine hydrolase n=1 Tax=Rhodococcus sp. NM-2 TaxID=3401174 RepID=UPI003AB0CF99
MAPGCQLYWPSEFEVCGAIRDKYNSLGAQFSFLLLPTSPELVNPDGFGRRSVFQNGPIYWSAAGGAHPVVNHFFAAWARKGYEGGYIGYPTTDEIVNPDGIGRRQHFTGAVIYWKLNEAYSIGGAIRDKWDTVGSERNDSLLGYPISDEIVVSGGGRMNRFERGVLYWSAATGAHPVTGPILDKWTAAGYETGTYGFPTGDQTSTDGNVTVEQQFQRGKITAPGPYATEMAFLNPGTTPEEMLAHAQRVAAERSASVIDVLQDALAGNHEEVSVSDPVTGSPTELPSARGPGDIFFSEVDTANINHGHNGIFVSEDETVEASNPEKGVQLIDNTAVPGGHRTVYGPRMQWVNTSDVNRGRAVDFARSQVGDDYNSNFLYNKQKIWDDRYNCSQLVWAAYYSASAMDPIDLDVSAGEEATPDGIFPREIARSIWVTDYP